MGIEPSRWLIEHLVQAEDTDRAMRSVSHQTHAAKFPVHRDMAGFDFEVSPVDRKLVLLLATRWRVPNDELREPDAMLARLTQKAAPRLLCAPPRPWSSSSSSGCRS